MSQHTIALTVNGEEHRVTTAANRTLLQLLREDLGLTGTQRRLLRGRVWRLHRDHGWQAGQRLPGAGAAGGWPTIVTIEGIGSREHPHPLQTAFVEEGAVQCGYCIPGIIMSSYALLQQNAQPTEEDIRQGIAGNLCRCTGYTKIVAAVKKAAQGA